MLPFTALLLICTLPLQDVNGPLGKGPQPAARPIAWELDFSYLSPQRIEVQAPGSSKPETYWYLVYTVTNQSGATQRFFPSFQLMTEDLRVFDTDTGISPLVFNAIRERHRQTHRYLVHPSLAIGDLLVGDGYARESVAIWRGVDVPGNNFTIFLGGLSGETHLITNRAPPSDGGDSPAPRHFTLRKSRELRYLLTGSDHARQSAAPMLVSDRWILR